jgi:hypothetical protein
VCFSPEADVVTGVIVTGIGVDALRHVDERRDHIALAALPVLFGLHQLTESMVWWSLMGDVSGSIGKVALWEYLVVAFVVLPIAVPGVIMWSEPKSKRRTMMALFVIIGAVVAGILLAAMLRGPVTVHLRPYHLAYGIKVTDGGLIVVAYVVAVCGALLCSQHRAVRVFGLINLVAVALIAWVTVDGFASVWCGWAAVSSAAIAARMRYLKPPHLSHAIT